MYKKFFLVLILVATVLGAQNIELKKLQALQFEDAFENPIHIPNDVQKLIVSFEKKGNTLMAEYLNKKPKGFLNSQNTVYIGDIHNMPGIIAYMFARPKMREYNFMIYIYDDEDLAQIIPYKEDFVSVVEFDKQGKFIKTKFIKKASLAFE